MLNLIIYDQLSKGRPLIEIINEKGISAHTYFKMAKHHPELGRAMKAGHKVFARRLQREFI